jgi:hypothetical protein
MPGINHYQRGTYMYPAYAHRGAEQAELADWPPSRRSGPEPGSDDMAPMPGPLNGLPQLSNMEKVAAVAALGAVAWYFFRKKRKGRR